MFGKNKQDVKVTRKGDVMYLHRRGEPTSRVIRIPSDVSAITDPGCGEIDAEIADDGDR